MNCKHKKIEGQTTKYYYCTVKQRAIEEYECKNCLLKISDLPEGFEEFFKGFRK